MFHEAVQVLTERDVGRLLSYGFDDRRGQGHPSDEVEVGLGDCGERLEVCRRSGGEVVEECVGVLEDVVDEHGVFADGVVDLGGEHTDVGSGSLVDVFPLGEHVA